MVEPLYGAVIGARYGERLAGTTSANKLNYMLIGAKKNIVD